MKGKARALESDTCEEYREALAAFRTLEVAEREHRDHTMLRVLLELYGERYARAKRERSALDFEDLELVARDLLRRDEGLREAYSSRFEHVLVDEFQDTNRLQNQLLGPALARATCSASATRTSRSTASGTPMSACSASIGRRLRRPGAPRASP